MYRVKVAGGVLCETVCVEKEWRSKVRVLPILEKTEVGKLLADELLASGWSQAGDVCRKKTDNWDAEFDSLTLDLNMKFREAQQVTVERGETEVSVDSDWAGSTKEEHQRAGEKVLQGILKSDISQAKAKVAKEFEQKLQDSKDDYFAQVGQEIKEGLNKAHAKALKKKAASLGEIQQIEEDEKSGELTIRVRI
jgi:hypothetical protein